MDVMLRILEMSGNWAGQGVQCGKNEGEAWSEDKSVSSSDS